LTNAEFKSIYNSVIILNFNFEELTNSFIPVVYPDSYNSLLTCSIQSLVTDFRPRIVDFKPFSLEEFVKESKDPKDKENQKTKEKEKMKQASPSPNANTFTNLLDLLLEKQTTDETNLEKKQIDKLYEKYVISLIKIYMSLKKYYLFIVNKILDEKTKSEFSTFLVLYL